MEEAEEKGGEEVEEEEVKVEHNNDDNDDTDNDDDDDNDDHIDDNDDDNDNDDDDDVVNENEEQPLVFSSCPWRCLGRSHPSAPAGSDGGAPCCASCHLLFLCSLVHAWFSASEVEAKGRMPGQR